MTTPQWVYVIESGRLLGANGLLAVGYSGHDEGVNNPGLCNAPNVGPIPHGRWSVLPPRNPVDHLGPLALPLVPVEGTATFGRSGFLIHGDTLEDVQHCWRNASHGCIILPRAARAAVAAVPDSTLRVLGYDREVSQ